MCVKVGEQLWESVLSFHPSTLWGVGSIISGYQAWWQVPIPAGGAISLAACLIPQTPKQKETSHDPERGRPEEQGHVISAVTFRNLGAGLVPNPSLPDRPSFTWACHQHRALPFSRWTTMLVTGCELPSSWAGLCLPHSCMLPPIYPLCPPLWLWGSLQCLPTVCLTSRRDCKVSGIGVPIAPCRGYRQLESQY